MEGIATIAYASLKAYWHRRNYRRLNAKDPSTDFHNTPPPDLGVQSQKPERKRRRVRIRRPRLKLGRRFHFKLGSSVRKFFLKMRDVYVNAMLRVGVSSDGYGGFVNTGSAKEYDDATVVEIYQRIVVAQQQQQGQGLMARKTGYQVTPVCLFR